MQVRELIAMLQKVNQEAYVTVTAAGGGIFPLSTIATVEYNKGGNFNEFSLVAEIWGDEK